MGGEEEPLNEEMRQVIDAQIQDLAQAEKRAIQILATGQQEVLEKLVSGHEDRIAEVLAQEIPRVPTGNSVKKADAWFDKIIEQNRALAEEYGVEVNEQGLSMAPGLIEQSERIRQYYLSHPEKKFVQKSYSELTGLKKVDQIIEPIKQRTKVTVEVIEALENLSPEKQQLFLEAIKAIGK